MSSMIKYITIMAAAVVLCSFAENKTIVKTPVTEYFFFELRPVNPQMPYYFSQTIDIEYNDSIDLRRQMRMSFTS